MAEATATGEVIRFNDTTGYGFIKPDEKGEDLFVYHSEIQAEGYRSLYQGQKVKFQVVDKDNKKQAVNVSVIDGSGDNRSRTRDGFGRGNRRGGGRGSYNGNGVVYRTGGGRQCYNCGGVGHISRDCSSSAGVGGGGGGCYNCGEFGHLARDCNGGGRGGNVGGGRGGGNGCYNCGEVGHLARECTSGGGGDGGQKVRTGGDGNCFNCGESGHFARECPNNA